MDLATISICNQDADLQSMVQNSETRDIMTQNISGVNGKMNRMMQARLSLC